MQQELDLLQVISRTNVSVYRYADDTPSLTQTVTIGNLQNHYGYAQPEGMEVH